MKYRKKPVVIDAVQWTGDNVNDITKFVEGVPDRIIEFIDGGFVKIKTLEGVMTANPGDYIIKGVKGEFYPCKPDIFKQTYDEISEELDLNNISISEQLDRLKWYLNEIRDEELKLLDIDWDEYETGRTSTDYSTIINLVEEALSEVPQTDCRYIIEN